MEKSNMTDKESYNKSMLKYFESVKSTIENTKNNIEFMLKAQELTARRLDIDSEYLKLMEHELIRSQGVLDEYNKVNLN